MKFGKRMAVGSMAVMTATALSANAQMMPQMAGTGYNMGQQGCGQQVQAGAGASSYLDEYNDIKKALAEEKRRLSDLRKQERDLKKEVDVARRNINGGIHERYSEFILEHIENGRLCSDYRDYREGDGGGGSNRPLPISPGTPLPAPPAREQEQIPRVQRDGKPPKASERAIPDRAELEVAEENQSRMPAQSRGTRSETVEESVEVAAGGQERTVPVRGFTTEQWQLACLPGKRGGVRGGVCKTYRSERSKVSENDCKLALTDYRDKLAELDQNARDMAESKELQKRYNKDLPVALRDAKDRYKEDTEAGICTDCIARGNGYVTQSSGPNWASVAANGVAAGLGFYMDRQFQKSQNENIRYVADSNAQLGAATYTTNPVPSPGYGLGFAANAVYGALGGGTGSGSFACAGGGSGAMYGNVGMSGPFGYPQGMFGGQLGGGMYNGGSGPWGTSGPWALGGAPGGMGGQFGLGAGMGNPYGMNGLGGQFGLGAGMGNPYGMNGMPGIGGQFGLGAGMGIPYGMNGMGNPYGMNGMGNPYGMNGMGNPYGMNGMGNPYGMNGMGNPYGMNGMGGQMDPQYQQAMMQLQMQQQQMYMQQQQQQAQNQMARQQTYMGLAQQMSELQMKMQMVMSGASLNLTAGFGSTGLGTTQYGFGNTGYGSSYNTIGGGNPSVPVPAPGNGNNSLGGGVGGGTIIPAGNR